MTPGERIILWVAGMLAVMLALNEGERCVRKWWRRRKKNPPEGGRSGV